ncbi:hypothetical protein BH09DEP1_BH09DEP1_6980 [soil metagenome]
MMAGVAHAKGTKAKSKKKQGQTSEQWTWFHRKVFNEQEQQENAQKSHLAYAKTDLPKFSQLVFSWNALRPAKGYFTFYGQVRNPNTQKWSKWHQMAVWGAEKQKSFETDADHMSSYHHVRLESKPSLLADGFAIKVEAHDGASLDQLKSFAVNLANLQLFKAEKDPMIPGLASVVIQGVPKYSQFELVHPRNDGLCSPTSCAMLTAYLLSRQVDPIDFAEKSHDQGMDKYGSWPFNMAHAFERTFEFSEGKILYAVKRLNSFKDLHQQLAKGIPVVVSVRGQIHGAPRPYKNGHLLVVIGYDTKTKELVCHDPAVSSYALVRKKYPIKSFLQAWERSHRLAYCADRIV